MNPTTDQNCGAASVDFSSKRICHLDWNILSPVFVGDGNFFLDLNISDWNISVGGDINKVVSSATAFVIDTNKPKTRISWDVNFTFWRSVDANVILTCSDTHCAPAKLFYRLDTDRTNSSSLPTAIVFDKNFLITLDGNYVVDFNVQDLAGNTSDLNTAIILIDKTGATLANNTPLSDLYQISSSNFQFAIDAADGNGSFGQTCDYNAYADGIVIPGYLNQTGLMNVSGTQCTTTVVYTPVPQQEIDLNVNITDFAGNKSGVFNTFSYKYIPSSGNPPGGGPGGGGGTIIPGSTSPRDLNLIIPGILELEPSANVLLIDLNQEKTYWIKATNLSDGDITLDISLSENFQNLLIPETTSFVLLPGQNRRINFRVLSPDFNFGEIPGQIKFVVNDGETEKSVNLLLRQGREFDLSFLSNPIVIAVLVFVGLYLLYTKFG